MKNEILEQSLTYRNFLAAQKKENILANRQCQLYSDVTELNRLEYSETPAIPKVERRKVAFPMWVKNMVKGGMGTLKELRP